MGKNMEGNSSIQEKEDAMLKVLESMSKKIEHLGKNSKDSVFSTSILNIKG